MLFSLINIMFYKDMQLIMLFSLINIMFYKDMQQQNKDYQLFGKKISFTVTDAGMKISVFFDLHVF